MTPLVRHCSSQDIVLVQINPIRRGDLPRTAREIHNRINEVAFNATLLKELRMLALFRRATANGEAEIDRWSQIRIHRIASDNLAELGASSKLNAEWPFLLMLRDEGRLAAEAFLDGHNGDLGQRSTYDIESLLEGV